MTGDARPEMSGTNAFHSGGRREIVAAAGVTTVAAGKRRRHRGRFALAAAVAAVWQVRIVVAGTDNWIGGTSDWNTPSNWDSGVVPGAGDTINIVNTDGTSPTITYDYVGPAISLGPLTVGASGGTETFLMATAGLSLSASNLDLGHSNGGSTISAVGVLTESAGADQSGQILMGVGSLDFGRYVLNGDGTVSTGEMDVGFGGSGDFEQSDGENTVSVLHLAWLAGSTGSYELSGSGSLTASAREEIGVRGPGNFVESGGVNIVGVGSNNQLNYGYLYLGDGAGSSGAYTLSGGSLVANSYEEVGYGGTGILNHSGGTNSIATALQVAFNSGSTGSYALSGTGSLLTPLEYVGDSGVGSFNQSGGTNDVRSVTLTRIFKSDFLYLGYSGGSTGTYALSGTGTLAAGYFLNRAAPMEGGVEYIGYSGEGVFNQSGGTNIIYANLGTMFCVGCNTGSNGIYILSGTGSLSVQGAENIGFSGTGLFNQSGGNNTNFGVELAANPGSTGTYILSGTGSLVANSNEYVGYGGTGYFEQIGGTNYLPNSSLNVGANSGSTGTYTLSGSGSLSVDRSEYIGNSGAGAFNQTGGTNTIKGSLYLGYNVGAMGSYALSGNGSLVSNSEFVGNNAGTFDQTGGTNNVGTLYVGGGSSAFSISAGQVIGASLNLSGGTFTQSGGSAIFSDLTGSGAATISGGIFTLNLGGTPSQLGSLNISSPATLDLQLGGYSQGVNYDLINLAGPSTLGGTLELDLVNGFTPQIGDQFIVMTDANPFTGQFNQFTSNNGLFTYAVDYGSSNNEVEITVTSVPEPAVLGIFGIGSLILRRRRRASKI